MLARELGGQPVMDMGLYMRPGAERLTVTLAESEPLLFVFPVHSWGLPKYLAGVLASMDVQGYVPGRNYVACWQPVVTMQAACTACGVKR